MRRLSTFLIVCSLLILVGCGSDDSSEAPEDDKTDVTEDVEEIKETNAADTDVTETDGETVEGERKCDPLDKTRCALPWPSNKFMEKNQSTETGYRVRFGDRTFPTPETDASRLTFGEYPKIDGYGLGVPIMSVFPNIDLSNIAGKYSVGKSMEDEAPIVLLEVKENGSTERVPYWAELDVNEEDNAEEQILFVRPAVILKENTRYIVAFRDIQNTDGESIPSSDAFKKLKNENTESGTELGDRQKRFNDIFKHLSDRGISRESLTSAWDFRTASSDYLHGTMLNILEDARQKVQPDGPTIEVLNTQKYDSSERENVAMKIFGRVEFPKYTKKLEDEPGSILNRNQAGEVVQNGTTESPFTAIIPRSALKEGQTSLMQLGHGLLTNHRSARGMGKVADRHNYTVFSLSLKGMSAGDFGVAAAASEDFNSFLPLTDRLHQGLLEYVLGSKAFLDKFSSLPPMADNNISVSQQNQYYIGSSQGGIFGQTVVALSQSIERGFLVVPGNNYSTLLQRSSSFQRFVDNIERAYPSGTNRAILLAAIQLPWNRTDPVSYVRRIKKNPFYDGADNDVLMAVAKGDYAVPPVSNEHVARSNVGIPIMEPYDETRSPWGVNTAQYPHEGSGIVLYDFGNPWPDDGNQPPKDDYGNPHGALADVPEASNQADVFFRTGEITDVCGGSPCQFGAAAEE